MDKQKELAALFNCWRKTHPNKLFCCDGFLSPHTDNCVLFVGGECNIGDNNEGLCTDKHNCESCEQKPNYFHYYRSYRFEYDKNSCIKNNYSKEELDKISSKNPSDISMARRSITKYRNRNREFLKESKKEESAIAYMNLNKWGGEEKTSGSKLAKAIEPDIERIKNEIDIIDPELIVIFGVNTRFAFKRKYTIGTKEFSVHNNYSSKTCFIHHLSAGSCTASIKDECAKL